MRPKRRRSFTAAAAPPPEPEDEGPTCAVCQCALADEPRFGPPCAHALHAACAEAYVREWRLNRPGVEAPCPTCKALGGCDFSQFPAALTPEEELAEQERRAAVARREQELADLAVARELFLEDFGDVVMVRRSAMRRVELDAILFLSHAMTRYDSPPPMA